MCSFLASPESDEGPLKKSTKESFGAAKPPQTPPTMTLHQPCSRGWLGGGFAPPKNSPYSAGVAITTLLSTNASEPFQAHCVATRRQTRSGAASYTPLAGRDTRRLMPRERHLQSGRRCTAVGAAPRSLAPVRRKSGCGIPNTAASATVGWAISTSSISRG